MEDFVSGSLLTFEDNLSLFNAPTNLDSVWSPDGVFLDEDAAFAGIPVEDGCGGGGGRKNVADWDPENCLSWAQYFCHPRGIDVAGVNIGNFGSYTDPSLRPAILGTGTRTEYYSAFDSSPPQDEGDYHITDISHVMPPAPDDLFEVIDDLFSSGSEVDSFLDGSKSSLVMEEEADLLNQELVDLGATGNGLHEVPGSPCPQPTTPIPSPLTQPLDSGTSILSKIKTNSRKRERGPKNWEYLMRLLADRSYNPKVIRWEDEEAMTFRIVKPHVVAKIWGERSNKSNLTYDSFARGLRYHYRTGALRAVSERQLVFKCGPKATKYLQEALNHVI
ncbi:ETS-related transcription factor Elf-1-like isoform X2 [Macrobrachium rosenbergii]|uniref:ETS-related transcription factor Elf-1-like isoform X2 n=1 Tax=Macrobrachium rosenbergii TaxID=79674 RepID=UPI0034D3E704